MLSTVFKFSPLVSSLLFAVIEVCIHIHIHIHMHIHTYPYTHTHTYTYIYTYTYTYTYIHTHTYTHIHTIPLLFVVIEVLEESALTGLHVHVYEYVSI